jgi:YcxB-like protein
MGTFKLRYPDSLVRRAARTRWWTSIGPSYPLTLLVGALFVGYALWTGDHSWYVGMLGSLIVLGIVVMIATYAVALRRSISALRRMGRREATLEVDEDRFRIKSDTVAREVVWSLIQKIWCFETFWLLFFSRSESMILPLEDLPNEFQDFVKAKVREHGGKIT